MASIFDELFAGPAAAPAAAPAPASQVFLAASRGLAGRVAELLAQHRDLDLLIPVNGFTALHASARRGSAEIVRLLLEYDAALLSARTTDGRTAGLLAAFEGHPTVLDALLAFDSEKTLLAECDKAGNSLLHYAAWGGSVACVQWLLRQGCWAQAKNLDGMLPLQFAAAGNFTAVVDLLLGEAQDEAQDGSSSGMSALHRAAVHGSTDIIRRLLVAQPPRYSPLAKADNGSIALHFAALHGHTDAVQELLCSVPSGVNEQNEFGLTPLHYACVGGYQDIALALLGAGADPAIRNAQGDNTLLLAAAAGRHEMSKHLARSCGCSPFAKDREGKSAIDKAVEGGFKELANSLAFESCVDLKFQELGGAR